MTALDELADGGERRVVGRRGVLHRLTYHLGSRVSVHNSIAADARAAHLTAVARSMDSWVSRSSSARAFATSIALTTLVPWFKVAPPSGSGR